MPALNLFLRSPRRITRKQRSSIIVHDSRGDAREYPLRDLAGIVIIGSKVQIDSDALTLLTSSNIPVTLVNNLGVTVMHAPYQTMDNSTRRAQYSLPPARRAQIALSILQAKNRGMVNILRYHKTQPPALPPPPESPQEPEDLLPWEASTSHILWRALVELIPQPILKELREKHGFTGRKPQNPDPFNKAVSLLYAMLYTMATKALLSAGLDPTEGIMHKTRYSTPLTYDYTEMYKPLAIHTVIRVVRTTKLTLAEDGNLDKQSTRTIAQEFFRTLQAKTPSNTTTYRQIHIKAHRLAHHIKTNQPTHYTYTYNPLKLKTRKHQP